MSTDQKPVTLVKPLQERGPEPTDPKSDAQDFMALVEDTLAALAVDPDTTRTAAPLIAAAFDARRVSLQTKLDRAERAADAYAVMDRTNQSVMQFAKRSIGHYLETNARGHAYAEQLGQFRHDVRQLITRAIDHQIELVPIKQLQQLLDRDLPPVPTAPVIVGMAPDARFRYGVFQWAGTDDDVTVQRTFIGWSLVVERPLIRAGLEPTFLEDDGQALTCTQMRARGLVYRHLV